MDLGPYLYDKPKVLDLLYYKGILLKVKGKSYFLKLIEDLFNILYILFSHPLYIDKYIIEVYYSEVA